MIKGDDRYEEDGGYSQTWTMIYHIYESRCTLFLDKYIDYRDHVSSVVLELKDDICFGGGMSVSIIRCSRKVQNNCLHLHFRFNRRFNDVMSFKFNETFNPQGGVMTWVYCYGRLDRGGLIVVEGKRKSREDKNLYAVTVAHYYAISHGYIFCQNKTDIGLSMVINFHVSNASLNYTVKGPDRHPSSALFYMFEQVFRSGNWKLASCPHCAGEAEGQSSEIMPKNNINNTNLPINMDWLRSAISTHTQLAKSTNQSEPSDQEPPSSSSSQPILAVRNQKSPPSAPQPGPRENRRMELIENKDINGNGNGNRIEGDQKCKFSIPFKFVNKFLK